MNDRLAGMASGFLVALMFAAALWALSVLPADARVVVHWGMDGKANGFMGKWAGLLGIPLLGALTWLLFACLPHGFTFPRQPELPSHARRALYVCVLFVETVAQLIIAISAVRAAGA
jgi:hypothetical protein